MKKNNETKQENGITLIALVVTIVVLLILAAVAINLTIGENGIMSRAMHAANTYDKSVVNESEEIKKLDDEFKQIVTEIESEQ